MRVSESHYSNPERLPVRAETDSFNSTNVEEKNHQLECHMFLFLFPQKE